MRRRESNPGPVAPQAVSLTLDHLDKRYVHDAMKHTMRQKGKKNGIWLSESYDESPYINGKFNNQLTTQKHQQKISITQRLRTDLGRSVGVSTAIQLVWFNQFTGTQPSH